MLAMTVPSWVLWPLLFWALGRLVIGRTLKTFSTNLCCTSSYLTASFHLPKQLLVLVSSLLLTDSAVVLC